MSTGGGAGGLGAANWANNTTLPPEAGNTGDLANGSDGGNAGIVILRYFNPNQTTCLF
jgi:hypothetical protein